MRKTYKLIWGDIQYPLKSDNEGLTWDEVVLVVTAHHHWDHLNPLQDDFKNSFFEDDKGIVHAETRNGYVVDVAKAEGK